MTEDEFNAMMPDGWFVWEYDGHFFGRHWYEPAAICVNSLERLLSIARNHARLECAIMAMKRRFASNPDWTPEYP